MNMSYECLEHMLCRGAGELGVGNDEIARVDALS